MIMQSNSNNFKYGAMRQCSDNLRIKKSQSLSISRHNRDRSCHCDSASAMGGCAELIQYPHHDD